LPQRPRTAASCTARCRRVGDRRRPVNYRPAGRANPAGRCCSRKSCARCVPREPVSLGFDVDTPGIGDQRRARKGTASATRRSGIDRRTAMNRLRPGQSRLLLLFFIQSGRPRWVDRLDGSLGVTLGLSVSSGWTCGMSSSGPVPDPLAERLSLIRPHLDQRAWRLEARIGYPGWPRRASLSSRTSSGNGWFAWG
jgi:hypothetical protein